MLKLENLNLDMIAGAMQDNGSMGLNFYLDLTSGEVVTAEADAQERNLAAINRVESHEAYRQMEEFTAELPEGDARTELEGTLIRRKPFGKFQGALNSFPAELEAWGVYKEQAMRQVVIDWLVGIGAVDEPA